MFDRITGHDRPKKILAGAYRRGRIASTYLFSGEEGIGKRSLAVEFGKLLNCTGTGRAHTAPCGTCSNCDRIQKAVHPDFRLIQPEDGIIRIDQIRELIEFLSFKPLESQYRIIVVDHAEKMNQQAANAFLKTLEEPPDKSVIILVTSMPEHLLDTVRSRCFQIRFSPLSRAETETVLEQLGVDPTRRRKLARQIQGAPGRLTEEDSPEGVSEDDVLSCLKNPGAGVRWKDRTEMEEWLRRFVLILRDLAVINTGMKDEDYLLSRKTRALHGEKLSYLGLPSVIRLYEEAVRLLGDLTFNINHLIACNYLTYLIRECYGDFNRG